MNNIILIGVILFSGCKLIPRKIIIKDNYQNGYSEGLRKGRKMFYDEYADMLQACISKDVVRVLKQDIDRYKEETTKAKEFGKRCLKGYKKSAAKLKTCESELLKCKP